MPPGSAWADGTATPAAGSSAVRHAYPLAVRDASFATAIGLMLRSLPYAMARFGVLLAASVAAIVWIVVTFGGAAWLGTHVATVFGWIWLVLCLLGASFVWGAILRYVLHLIECGHVAVLTELITKGAVGNGSESMFAYGRRVVIERFVQANVLFGLNALVRGVVEAFHRTLDWIADLVPIPGLDSLSHLVNMVLKAATRYLDKVIFSYNLARSDEDPWRSSREGLVYYTQNARPVLKMAIWSVILERAMSVALWFVLLVPAGLITLALPQSARELGGLMTVLIAVLLAGPLRAAFIKPLFLIMMTVRFHATIEGQPINAEWDARLAAISGKFRDLGRDTATAMGQSRWAKLWS
ncbi:hypothetical protein [Limobrevibacterium gyesilva]|uniref:Uncharacterized protein n=1 Tax=Limobrevibacterium gyesilva TaxID=2991712 RepID=A0AA42CF65_9PROT|nr:hypothetical protein [Limobrevibacterium gyesilva]MCW3476868.1 hypothetical protein [Limobrevibacterium gyesilva]